MIDYKFSICDRSTIKSFVEEYHYSKNINGLKSSYCFKIEHDGKMVGACLFGHLSTTSWKKYGDDEKSVIELRRLVLLDECPKNTESWFVSRCLNYIKKNSTIKIVVSYADPEYGHVGYIYQACNFLYLGKTNKDTVLLDTETGKRYHSRAMRTKYKGELKPFAKRLCDKYENGLLEVIEVEGKHIYIYPLNKKERKKWNSVIYPKDAL